MGEEHCVPDEQGKDYDDDNDVGNKHLNSSWGDVGDDGFDVNESDFDAVDLREQAPPRFVRSVYEDDQEDIKNDPLATGCSMHSPTVISTAATEPRSNRSPYVPRPGSDIYTFAVPCNTKEGEAKAIHSSTLEERRKRKRRNCGVVLAILFVLVVVAAVIAVVIVQLLNRIGITGDITYNSPPPMAPPSFPAIDINATMPGLCNGLANLCLVRVNAMLFASMNYRLHQAGNNSSQPSFERGRALAATDHDGFQLEEAVKAGYRGLNLDLGKCDNGQLKLVQGGLCSSAGTRDAVEVLTNLVQFLQENPSEVVLLPIQIQDGSGGGRVFLADIVQLFDSVPGWNDLLFSHPGPDYPWPVLQDLVDSDKRILFFFYNAVETCQTTDCPSGFHDWFQYAAETSADFEVPADFDKADACSATRGGGSDFYSLNLVTRNPDFCEQLNNETFLEGHMETCSLKTGMQPSLLTVDCGDVGDDVLLTVEKHNSFIVPPIVQQSNVTLALLGAVSTMGNETVIDSFVRNCNRFFATSLETEYGVSNVECKVETQKYIAEPNQMLLVIVQVSVDTGANVTTSWVFNSSMLESAIIETGLALRNDLADNGDNFFDAVYAIQVARTGDPSAASPTPTSTTPVRAPTASPIKTALSATPTAGPALPFASVESPTSSPTNAAIVIPADPTVVPTSAPAPSADSTADNVMLVPTVRNVTAVQDTILNVIGFEKLGIPDSPYSLALDWILNSDAMYLTQDAPNLVQRYTAAYLYLATSRLRPWASCGPAGFGEDAINCIYKKIVVIEPVFQAVEIPSARWLSNTTECMWAGITCNDQNHIRAVELFGMNMTGWFPGGAQYLPYLDTLALPFGELQGTIPPEPISGMKNLVNLQLQYNNLIGQFSLGFLTLSDKLQRINLSSNMLSGSLPSDVDRMNGLTGLLLSKNALTGPIPTSIGNLVNLTQLRLDGNSFSGMIPDSVGNAQSVTELWLGQNLLIGKIPTTLGNLKALRDFRVQNNTLSGSVPESLYELAGLTRFELQGNHLSGTISSKIGQMPELFDLNLSTNRFTGTLPSELGQLVVLNSASFSRNDLSGSVPFQLCNLRGPIALNTLDVDCLAGEQSGFAEVVCSCCTLCCDPSGQKCIAI